MIISISTNKGGSGKTTIATNLACGLAKRFPNKKICLVDVDAQCGVSIIFGYSGLRNENKSVLTAITNPDIHLSLISEKVVINQKTGEILDNLFLFFSEPNMRCFEMESLKDSQYSKNYISFLNNLDKRFDYVIVDTPPAMQMINILTFSKSDIIISPFEPERQNIEGCLNVVRELKNNSYKNKPWILFLPLRANERTIIHKSLLSFVEDTVIIERANYQKLKLADFRIPVSTKYSAVPALERVPLILSNKKSKPLELQKENINKLVDLIVGLK